MKLKAKDITLENVKKSDYWGLISILVWNHYSEERYQDESMIEIKEDWHGKCGSGSTHSSYWNNPNYYEEGYVRTLGAIKITFTRSDYITHIYIHVDGDINCFGMYTDQEKVKAFKAPHYEGRGRNLTLTNWLLDNNFLDLTVKLTF